MSTSHSPARTAAADTSRGGQTPPAAAMRLPMPVPLLLQLYRPLSTMDDVDSLAAQLDCARARGCF